VRTRRFARLIALVSLVGCDGGALLAPKDTGPEGTDATTIDAPLDTATPVDATDGGDAALPAATRTKTLLDADVRFFASNDLASAEAPAFDDASWPTVHWPHTWNGLGKSSGNTRPFPSYSHAWYRTRFRAEKKGRVYVSFEGVATIADVYVNGKKLGQHRGAYTRFVFDATDAVVAGDGNVLALMVSNADVDTKDTIPSNAISIGYFRPYGGVYRKAWLLETDAVHIDPTDLASSGVYLTQKNVDATGADLHVTTMLANTTAEPRAIGVEHRILDGEGKVLQTLATMVTLGASARGQSEVDAHVGSPHLWGPKDPYLHRVITTTSVDGRVTDAVEERLGFRDFRLSDTDFRINGVSMPLRGVSKHQESEAHQTAVTDDELRGDWDRLQELGVNFVRLVHYPHAQLEYDLADERGLVVWTENGLTVGAPYSPTGELITREMVKQSYNHPSIAFFGAGNESANDGDAALIDAVVRYAKAIRSETSTHAVVYASNSHFSDPSVDFITHNLYPGWYGGGIWDFTAQAAESKWVSETGGRAVISQHTDYGAEKLVLGSFEPEEYLQLVNESRAQAVFRDEPTKVPMCTWWVFRDFLLDGRPHGVNDSGLVTYDGERKKDSFYLLQSFLRPELPVIHVASSTYFVRRGAADNGIKVYSNRPKLHLAINGVDVGARANGEYAQGPHPVENVFFWNAPLHQGMNVLVVTDDAGHRGEASVYFAGSGGLPARTAPAPIVTGLSSSNGKNAAYFFDRAIEPDFPVFWENDGTADNTFGALPKLLDGARAIVTAQTSKTDLATTLSFTIDASIASADVLIVATDAPAIATFGAAGFADTGVTGTWRDAGMDVVPMRVLRKTVAGGTPVTVPAASLDYAVLVRPTP
jgi:beta-galactosidase